MTTPSGESQFEAFSREYEAWRGETQTLPFRRDRATPQIAFERDLGHLIDYVLPVFAAATKHSTQFDYPKVAAEYLQDLNQTEAELESGQLADMDRLLYVKYIGDFRCPANICRLPAAKIYKKQPTQREKSISFDGIAESQ
jgi:hypothetical protein